MQTTYMKGASLAPKFQIKEAFSRLPKIAAFVSNYFKSDKKLKNTLNYHHRSQTTAILTGKHQYTASDRKAVKHDK